MAKPTAPANSRNGNSLRKWRTLKHKGPQFHAPYKRLGAQVFRYNNRTIKLSARSEEVVVMYSKYLMRKNRPRTVPAKLKNNFFEDWKKYYMTPSERKIITNFARCNFSPVINRLNELDEKRKNMSKKQKDKEKELKEAQKRKFQFVSVDGRREQISNFMVEPPGLFVGRGDNNNIGRIKARIEPEDVTINCDKNCRPKPPPGRRWQSVIHDETKGWLARYKQRRTGEVRYIFLAPASHMKTQNDKKKYDKAEELSRKITQIRRRCRRDLDSESLEIRQHATVVHFLDTLALRVGNEKDAGEADTVGCCTLRVEHLKIVNRSRRLIKLTFRGKDSVPYEREVALPQAVFDNVREFVNEKDDDELIFDEINASSLNRYLDGIMDGLTAKVFRTFQATQCYKKKLEQLSKNLRRNASPQGKKMIHLKANLEVAKLLNHKVLVAGTRKAKNKGLKRLDERVKEAGKNRNMGSNAEKQDARKKLKKLKDEAKMKQDKGTWALRTSLANYIDPRIVKRWCRTYNLDIGQVYSKALQDKFKWALEGRSTRSPASGSSEEQPNRTPVLE